jgi:hypothetical protein
VRDEGPATAAAAALGASLGLLLLECVNVGCLNAAILRGLLLIAIDADPLRLSLRKCRGCVTPTGSSSSSSTKLLLKGSGSSSASGGGGGASGAVRAGSVG